MANLRDGGIIVIGVSQQADQWTLPGIAAADLSTYDPDLIAEYFNAFASPPIVVDVVMLDHAERSFLVIQVREFVESPVVCKKDNATMHAGDLFVRPRGVAKTTRTQNAEMMHGLLDLASEKRARAIIETMMRVAPVLVLPNAPLDADRYSLELEGL